MRSNAFLHHLRGTVRRRKPQTSLEQLFLKVTEIRDE